MRTRNLPLKRCVQYRLVASPTLRHQECLQIIANREEKWLRHAAMVATFLDLNKQSRSCCNRKKTKKLTCMSFRCMIALRDKTVAHTFPLSFDNTNDRLSQERLLRSRNLATMVT